jgi:hypothetical protein
MTCAKPFSITIDPDVVCPDWPTLLWDAAIIIGTSPPDAEGAFTPNAAPGDSYQATASCVDFFTGGLLLVQASVEGNITYNGGGCNCQVTVNFTGVGDPTEATCSIRIQQNGVDVLAIQSFDSSTSGNYTFPFSLVDTLGNPETVNVRIVWESDNLAGGPSSVDMAGTLSNVP